MTRNLGRMLAGALVFGALLATATASHAYVTVKGGYFMPNSDAKGLKDWKEGFGGELTFGGELNPSFALEGGVGYWTTKPDQGSGLNLGIVPVTLNAKLLLTPSPNIGFYVGGGAGLYVGMLSGSATDGMESDDKTGTGFGVQAFAGIELPMQGLALIGEFRWSKADVKFGESDEATNLGGMTGLIGLKF